MQKALRDYLSRCRRPEFESAVCGHRGASALAPENTIAAFKGAIEAGCDLVELDVLLTRDRELVVFHDEKLGRTTDRKGGRVRRLTLEQLREADAGCWFAPDFKGEKVPSLGEVLGALAHRAVPMIELKQRARLELPVLVPRLAEVVARAGYSDHVIVIAWDDRTARAVKAALPEALIARIAFSRFRIRRAKARGWDGVVPWRAFATARFLRDAREAGLFVAPWTVNRPKDIDFFARAATDVLVSDVPHVVREHLGRLAAERTASAAAEAAAAVPAATATG